MPFDENSTYQDPFSNATGNKQMGGGKPSAQIGSVVKCGQMGDSDIVGKSSPETLKERYARWSPGQVNSQPTTTKQMGGWTCSGQQMG